MNQLVRVRRLFVFSVPAAPDPAVATPARSEAGDGGAARPWRAGWGFRLLSFAPFVAAVFGAIVAPTYSGGLTSSPPDIVGLPLAGVLYLGFLMLGVLGSAIVWHARSRRAVYAAIFACTLPAIFGLLYTPALVLYMQNLTV